MFAKLLHSSMTQIIDNCKRMSEEAVEIAERLEEVDGDITELNEEEQQAFNLLAKAVNGLFEEVDTEEVETNEVENQNKSTGRAFY